MIDNEEFAQILKDIIRNDTVKKLKYFRQHYNTSRYTHCLNVAYYTYVFCKKHNLDYVSATKAAMLHDLFLYDWREKQKDIKGLHGFVHPRIALQNSLELFELNGMQKDIILKHMWPLTVIPPRYIESLVVSCADKYSALIECIKYMKLQKNIKIKES